VSAEKIRDLERETIWERIGFKNRPKEMMVLELATKRLQDSLSDLHELV
jgi:hypothetical protein